MGNVAHAQSTLEWDRNTETDMSHYNVYVCSPLPCTVTVASTKSANIPQTTLGVVPSFALPTNTEGRAAVTATDTSGNESGLSVSLPFDRRSPAIPINPRTR